MTMWRVLEWISQRALSVAGWCYVVITLLICFDVVARRMLGFSSGATIELSGYLLGIGMSWGLAATLIERGHVRIDLLVQKLPLNMRNFLHVIALSMLIMVTAFFAWGAISLTRDSLVFRATDVSQLRTPLAWPQGIWAAGFVLFAIVALALLLKALLLLLYKKRSEADAMLMARTYEDEAAETLEATRRPQ